MEEDKNKMMKKWMTALSAGVCFAACGAAFAWDGSATGQIDLIQGAGAGGMPFRVVLKNAPALCGNTLTWAYLDDADGNYKTNASILLTAKAAGSAVALYSNRDSNGYCRIGFLQIQ